MPPKASSKGKGKGDLSKSVGSIPSTTSKPSNDAHPSRSSSAGRAPAPVGGKPTPSTPSTGAATKKIPLKGRRSPAAGGLRGAGDGGGLNASSRSLLNGGDGASAAADASSSSNSPPDPAQLLLADMVTAAQQNAARRRAALEAEAERQLKQARRQDAAEREAAREKAKAEEERFRQRLRIARALSSPTPTPLPFSTSGAGGGESPSLPSPLSSPPHSPSPHRPTHIQTGDGSDDVNSSNNTNKAAKTTNKPSSSFLFSGPNLHPEQRCAPAPSSPPTHDVSTRVHVQSGMSAAAAAESEEALAAGMSHTSRGAWAEAFSRRRAMNRMTEAVAAAAAANLNLSFAGGSISSLPSLASNGDRGEGGLPTGGGDGGPLGLGTNATNPNANGGASLYVDGNANANAPLVMPPPARLGAIDEIANAQAVATILMLNNSFGGTCGGGGTSPLSPSPSLGLAPSPLSGSPRRAASGGVNTVANPTASSASAPAASFPHQTALTAGIHGVGGSGLDTEPFLEALRVSAARRRGAAEREHKEREREKERARARRSAAGGGDSYKEYVEHYTVAEHTTADYEAPQGQAHENVALAVPVCSAAVATATSTTRPRTRRHEGSDDEAEGSEDDDGGSEDDDDAAGGANKSLQSSGAAGEGQTRTPPPHSPPSPPCYAMREGDHTARCGRQEAKKERGTEVNVDGIAVRSEEEGEEEEGGNGRNVVPAEPPFLATFISRHDTAVFTNNNTNNTTNNNNNNNALITKDRFDATASVAVSAAGAAAIGLAKTGNSSSEASGSASQAAGSVSIIPRTVTICDGVGESTPEGGTHGGGFRSPLLLSDADICVSTVIATLLSGDEGGAGAEAGHEEVGGHHRRHASPHEGGDEGPPHSDIKSNVPKHVPTMVRTVGCPLHDLAPFVGYCHTCRVPICTVCSEMEHPSIPAAGRGAGVGRGPTQSAEGGPRRAPASASGASRSAAEGEATGRDKGKGKAAAAVPFTSSPSSAVRHHTEPLADFISDAARNITAVHNNNRSIQRQLAALEADHPAVLQRLHGYIDDEMSVLLRAVAAKRGALHSEVEAVKASLLQLLTRELDTCEQALGQLAEGRAVLEMLADGQGTSRHPRMGQLILGTVPYDAFLREADPPIAPPPRVTEQLQLQLPVQSLQDVCDMVSWTETSLTSAPQIFPM